MVHVVIRKTSRSRLRCLASVIVITAAIAATLCAARVAGAAQRDEDAHTIPNVGKLSWQSSGQTTFAGAMELAMTGLPQRADYATIMGATGLAYRMRWHQPATGKPYGGVAPLGELADDVEPISHLFGIRVRLIEAPAGKTAERDRIGMELKAAIAKDRPVICYVNPHMDCAVVYGFLDGGKTILVRDYYPETAATLPFDKLGEHFWFVEPGVEKPLSPSGALIAGLKTAVKNGTRTDQPEFGGGHFVYGAKAFSAWRDALSAVDDGANGPRLTTQTNWWVMNGLSDARAAAAAYLRKSAKLLGAGAQGHLARAADLFQQEAGFTRNAIDSNELFLPPFSGKGEGDWTKEVRKRERELLTRCEKVEAEALAEIRMAIAAARK